MPGAIGTRWWRARGGTALRLPAAFVHVLAAAVLVGEGAALLGLRPLSHLWGSRVVLALLLLVAVVSLAWPRDTVGVEGPGEWVCFLPSFFLILCAGWARAALSPGARAEWFLGGDHVRHLLFVAEEQAAGNLSYVHQPYPRAWHTVLTCVWTASGGRPDGAGLASLVDLMSTATWLLPVFLSVATGTFAIELARSIGLSHRAVTLAGAAAALTVLLPPFLSVYQALGFETSLVAAVALAVSVKLVVAPPSLASLGTLTAAVVVVAHTWQLLLPVAALSLLVVAVRLMRDRGSGRQVLAVLVFGAVAAYPGIVGVARGVGVGHASVSDIEAPYPLLALMLGLVAACWLGLRESGRGRPDLVLPLLVALPAITAVGVAAQQRISLDHYYPSKLLWQSAALGLAPLCAGLIAVMRRLEKSTATAAAAARILLSGSAVLLGGYAAISPVGAFVGAWSTVDGPRTLSAVTSPDARYAQVVWLGARGDDTIGRILLDFYRAADTMERTPSGPQDVTGECRLLAASPAPAVLTDHDETEVRERYRCVSGLRVVQVR